MRTTIPPAPGSPGLSRRTLLQGAGALALSAGFWPGAAAAQQPTYTRANVNSPAGAKALASYEKAIRVLLALPPTDPRNWYRLALIHTIDCPHGNWWFLPWHRGYLGYVEQICRAASGDATFAFPYWDWTADPRVPDAMFNDVLTPTSNLYIASFADFSAKFQSVVAGLDMWKVQRASNGAFDGNSQYAQLLARFLRGPADLWFDLDSDPRGTYFFDLAHARGLTRAQPNLDADTKKTVSMETLVDALAPKDYITFASAKTFTHSELGGYGVLEGQPHNNVHLCVGGATEQDPNGGFMQANLSPIDPIFYLHHANIDRIWDVWTRKQIAHNLSPWPNGVPAKSTDQIDPRTDFGIWVYEPFMFYVDVNGATVQQNVAGDYAQIGNFAYNYQPGSGEAVVTPQTAQATKPAAGARSFLAKITDSLIGGGSASRASVDVPADVLTSTSADESKLFARVTVAFNGAAHTAPLRLSVGNDNAGADAPGFAGVLAMFGHHTTHGPVSFLVPLSTPVRSLHAQNALRPNAPIDILIAQGGAAGGHPAAHATTSAASAEILSVAVEVH